MMSLRNSAIVMRYDLVNSLGRTLTVLLLALVM